MPARFINISNSGQARFTNVSNSGRAIFGSGSAEIITTSTTTTTTTIVYNTFTVYALNSVACAGGDVRLVRTSNDDASLANASTNSSALYRMPQDVLLTGYTYVRDEAGNIYNIGSIDGVVGLLDSSC